MAFTTAIKTYYIRKVTGGISSQICRGFSFQVYAQLRCYGNCHMVYLVYYGIQKLVRRRYRPYDDKTHLEYWISICKSRVVLIRQKDTVYLLDYLIRSTQAVKLIKDFLPVIVFLGKEEVDYPASDKQRAAYHQIISSHMIGTPLPEQSATNRVNAMPS